VTSTGGGLDEGRLRYGKRRLDTNPDKLEARLRELSQKAAALDS